MLFPEVWCYRNIYSFRQCLVVKIPMFLRHRFLCLSWHLYSLFSSLLRRAMVSFCGQQHLHWDFCIFLLFFFLLWLPHIARIVAIEDWYFKMLVVVLEFSFQINSFVNMELLSLQLIGYISAQRGQHRQSSAWDRKEVGLKKA